MVAKEKESFKLNFSWILIGNIVLAFMQFLILVVLAKLGNPKIVGQFTLALSICSPVFIFSNLKLRTVQATDVSSSYTFNEYRSLRIITSTISVAFIMILTLVIGYDFSISILIFIFSLTKAVEMQSDLYYGLFQKNEQMDIIAKSMIFRGVFNFIIIAITFYFCRNLFLSITGMFLANLSVFLGYDLKRAKVVLNNNERSNLNKKFTLNKKVINLFTFAFPLGISTALGSLNTNIPRYFIERNIGQYELGIFSGITYLLVAANTLMNALSQVATPRLSRYFFNKDYKLFKSLILRLVSIGFIIGCISLVVVWLFGEQILTILYSKEYSKYNDVLIIVTIGATFLYSSVFLGTAVTAVKRFKVQPFIHLFSLAVITSLSYAWIGHFGLVGAAWTIFFGYLASSLGYILVLFYVFGFNKKTIRSLRLGD